VYAGYLEQTDANIGRVVEAIRDLGQLDNTLVIYIVGDNGASAEGRPQGMLNQIQRVATRQQQNAAARPVHPA
jgi:arylsulfatase